MTRFAMITFALLTTTTAAAAPGVDSACAGLHLTLVDGSDTVGWTTTTITGTEMVVSATDERGVEVRTIGRLDSSACSTVMNHVVAARFAPSSSRSYGAFGETRPTIQVGVSGEVVVDAAVWSGDLKQRTPISALISLISRLR